MFQAMGEYDIKLSTCNTLLFEISYQLPSRIGETEKACDEYNRVTQDVELSSQSPEF